MSVSDGYLQFVLEQLHELGWIKARRMFGGVGLYCNDVFFALIADDILRFKTGDSNRGDYIDAGMGPFRPYRDKDTVMDYYQVPVEVLEDRDELQLWARRAIAVALEKR